jgi:membrane carboxypeptidase/penicillin-binding protein
MVSVFSFNSRNDIYLSDMPPAASMKIIGPTVALSARLFLRSESQALTEQLHIVYHKYCASIRRILPTILINALIAAEDHRFYKHRGIDLLAVARALWCIIARGVLVGGAPLSNSLFAL